MLLEIKGLEKRFGGARALAGANLSVAAGSVHGLLGENGAGKSTLIKTLSGLVRPDAGEIRVDGEAIAIGSVREAEALGFRFIHQELSLVPQFDAVENAFVGRSYPKSGPFIDGAAMRRAVAATAAAIAPYLPLDVPAGRLTTGQKQLVEIIRALMNEPARLVVMDEPTASLSEGEARRLHEAVRTLAARGVAVIYISHRLDEVAEICDAFTVLRNGATAGTGVMQGTTRADLVRMMSGHEEVTSGRRRARRRQAGAGGSRPAVRAAWQHAVADGRRRRNPRPLRAGRRGPLVLHEDDLGGAADGGRNGPPRRPCPEARRYPRAHPLRRGLCAGGSPA